MGKEMIFFMVMDMYKERVCVIVILFVLVIHVYVCWYIFVCFNC